MSDHGYGVDIFACQDAAFLPLAFPGKDVRVFILQTPYRQGETGWRWHYLTRWLPDLVVKCRHEQYGCLIGIDPWGLLLASLAGQLARITVVYFSLEIMVWHALRSPYHRALKWLERQANRLAVFTIIQDWDRAALLMRENHIPKHLIEILPNAPRGEAKVERSDYLRHALGIAAGRPIALYFGGSVHPAAKSLELAQNALEWDSDIALVFHTRYHLTGDYAAACRKQIDGRHTYLSDEPIANEQLRNLVASADIGIAFYPTTVSNPDGGENAYTIGRSSGKIAYYLQCGVPIITSPLPSVRAYIDKYNCGIFVEQVKEVESAITTLLQGYAYYSANALVCFRELFDFDLHFAPILKRLEATIES